MLLCYYLSQVWESAIHKRCRNVTILLSVTGVGKCFIHQRCRNVTICQRSGNVLSFITCVVVSYHLSHL